MGAPEMLHGVMSMMAATFKLEIITSSDAKTAWFNLTP
jgi:hypothetical protein